MAEADNNTINSLIKLLSLTKGAPSILPDDIKGRWVWGRPFTSTRQGVVHVEVLPTDSIVNEAAMKSFIATDFAGEREERWKTYQSRCAEIANRINEEAIESQGLFLLIKKNGQPTRKLKQLIAVIRLSPKTTCTSRTLR